MKKEISIQADSFIKIKETKILEISKHSIGVGSICVHDEVITSKIVDHSIATQQQKLNHSKMISFERSKRRGKKLGARAKNKLMESKRFQSSEDEQKIVEKSQEMSDKLQPEPAYLKQEVNYIKMVSAYNR